MRLSKRYEIFYIPSPWFAFYSSTRETVQYCQPDGLLFVEELGRVVVCEVKYNHVPDAYFQLNQKYLPVVAAAFPSLEISLCEIVRWYDPAVDFPCKVKLTPDLRKVAPGDFGLHILNR